MSSQSSFARKVEAHKDRVGFAHGDHALPVAQHAVLVFLLCLGIPLLCIFNVDLHPWFACSEPHRLTCRPLHRSASIVASFAQDVLEHVAHIRLLDALLLATLLEDRLPVHLCSDVWQIVNRPRRRHILHAELIALVNVDGAAKSVMKRGQ